MIRFSLAMGKFIIIARQALAESTLVSSSRFGPPKFFFNGDYSLQIKNNSSAESSENCAVQFASSSSSFVCRVQTSKKLLQNLKLYTALHTNSLPFVSASLLCPARECVCVFATLDRLEAMADSQARHRQHKRAANLIYIILHREFIIITRRERGRVGPVHSTFRLRLPLSKA